MKAKERKRSKASRYCQSSSLHFKFFLKHSKELWEQEHCSGHSRAQDGKWWWGGVLTNEQLTCRLPNGQVVDRQWVTYSPSTGNIYCFPCKLFSSQKSQAFVTGYFDWKHPEGICEHETSAEHLACMLALHQRATGATVDSDLVKQIDGEAILERGA